MEEQILKDQSIYPSMEVIESSLTERDFLLYRKLLQETGELGLKIEWRYYNDGKAWLGKLLHKKKNTAWLSVWNAGFKVSVFLTAKTVDGFNDLNIAPDIKARINGSKGTGKLIPAVISISNEQALADLITILNYKKQK